MIFRRITLSVSLFIALACALDADVEKGEPISPPDSNSVVGSYYCGDRKGYNVTISLKHNGTYSAEWHGCLGKYGDSLGRWALSGTQIVLTPEKETDMMKDHLKILDVLTFKGDWIFVRADNRDFYDEYGVSRYSCFQKQKTGQK